MLLPESIVIVSWNVNPALPSSLDSSTLIWPDHLLPASFGQMTRPWVAVDSRPPAPEPVGGVAPSVLAGRARLAGVAAAWGSGPDARAPPHKR